MIVLSLLPLLLDPRISSLSSPNSAESVDESSLLIPLPLLLVAMEVDEEMGRGGDGGGGRYSAGDAEAAKRQSRGDDG